MVVFLVLGIATRYVNLGWLWSGYLLDMVGPAWTYILFRGLFTAYAENRWTLFFTPAKTVIILLLVSFGIETAQYFEWYDATFDPWDLAAYCSLMLPAFMIDYRIYKGR